MLPKCHVLITTRTLTQDLKGKQSAVEKPFHDLARRLEARERELTQMASEGAKLADAAKDLEAFIAAKKEEMEKAPPISAKIDKLRDQVRLSSEELTLNTNAVESVKFQRGYFKLILEITLGNLLRLHL